MREDMNKVIVERPRLGHSRKFREHRHDKTFNRNVEDQNTHESMRFRYKVKWTHKNFNEHLNPLFRWLHKQVGKRWDDVYSEISTNFDKTKVINDHILLHVKWYVNQHNFIENGKVLCMKDYNYGRELAHDELYVDDKGILRKYRKEKQPPIEKKLTAFNDGNLYFKQVNGIWYSAQRVKQEYKEERCPLFDSKNNITGYQTYFVAKYLSNFVVGERKPREVHRHSLPKNVTYGFVNIKQVSHNVLKKYSLSNDV